MVLQLGLDAAAVWETNKGDNEVLGGAVHPQGQVHPVIVSLTLMSVELCLQAWRLTQAHLQLLNMPNYTW